MATRIQTLTAVLLFFVPLSTHSWANEEFPREWFSGADDPKWKDRVALTGKAPPQLTVAQWVGKSLTQDDVRGKIVVVDFWATWCGPCLAMIPENNSIYEKYKGDVVVIGVCSSSGQERMEPLAKQRLIKYPIARDPDSRSAQAFLVGWWPTYAVIDRRGTLRALGVAGNHVEDVVKKLLEEQPVPAAKNALEKRDEKWLVTVDAPLLDVKAQVDTPSRPQSIPNEERLLPITDITLEQVREALHSKQPALREQLGDAAVTDLEQLIFDELRWWLRKDAEAYLRSINRWRALRRRPPIPPLRPDEFNSGYYLFLGGDVKRVQFQANGVTIKTGRMREFLNEYQLKSWSEDENLRTLLDEEAACVELKLVEKADNVQPPYPGPFREVIFPVVLPRGKTESGFGILGATRQRVDNPETEIPKLVGQKQ